MNDVLQALKAIVNQLVVLTERIAPSKRAGQPVRFDPGTAKAGVLLAAVDVPQGFNYVTCTLRSGNLCMYLNDPGQSPDPNRADFYFGPTPTPSPTPLMAREEKRCWFFVDPKSADPVAGVIYLSRW